MTVLDALCALTDSAGAKICTTVIGVGIVCLIVIPTIFGLNSLAVDANERTSTESVDEFHDEFAGITTLPLNQSGCTDRVRYTVNITVSESRRYTEIYYVPCMDVASWFKCTQRRYVYRVNYRLEPRIMYDTIKVCCDGYLQNGNMCLFSSGMMMRGNAKQPRPSQVGILTTFIISIIQRFSNMLAI